MAKATQTEMVTVEFSRDYVVDDQRKGTKEEERYKKGERKNLPIASAKHFISRGVAHPFKKT